MVSIEMKLKLAATAILKPRTPSITASVIQILISLMCYIRAWIMLNICKVLVFIQSNYGANHENETRPAGSGSLKTNYQNRHHTCLQNRGFGGSPPPFPPLKLQHKNAYFRGKWQEQITEQVFDI